MSKAPTKKPAKNGASGSRKLGASVESAIKKYAASSNYTEGQLRQVARRGMGAYFSSGSRPGQTPQSWAIGRVRSAATGKGGARKADADILRKRRPKKNKV